MIRISGTLDDDLGTLRLPTEVRGHERDRRPMSLQQFDAGASLALRSFKQAAECGLVSYASQRNRFIWAVGESGAMVIAFEEVALFRDGSEGNGHTRRIGVPKSAADEKKLGHPTLLGGGVGRVAGELYLDMIDDVLRWVFSFSSGRYCSENQPTPKQRDTIHDHFNDHIGPNVIFNPEV